MQKDIRSILEELYALDPSMKQHEAEIERIVQEMLSSAPDVKIDTAFLAQLRARLVAQAELLAHQAPARTGLFARMGAPVFALGGVVAAIAIIVPVIYFQLQTQQGPAGRQLALKQAITDVEKSAFGSLSSSASDQQGQVSAPSAASPRPQSGGGGGGGGGYAGMSVSTEVGGVSMPSPTIIAPDYTTYAFTYKGEALTQGTESLPVYRKQKDYSTAQSLTALLGGAKLGAIDLSKFQDARITYLNILEDRANGYALYVNLEDNSVSMSINWERWPELMRAPEPVSGTPPPESELIELANAFAEHYGIDLSSYGTPRVMLQPEYRIMAESGQTTPAPLEPGVLTVPAYYPTDISVLYPLIVDGKTTIDENGNDTGLIATISLRTKAVTNFGSIEIPSYERSLYPAETDATKLIAAAERGGMMGMYPQLDGTRVTTLELGTPTIALMRTWHYDGTAHMGREIMVPAYVFPIQNKPAHYWQSSVVIPLVKDIFDNRYGKPVPLPMGRGGIEPMPYIELSPAIKE